MLCSKYFVTFFFANARRGRSPRNEGWERGSNYQGFILSQGEGCWEVVGGMATNTPKVRLITSFQILQYLSSYLEWPKYILRPEGRENNGGVKCPWDFSCFSFVFLSFNFFHGHLPQTSGFRWAKQIFVANSRCSTWTILSDRNIFCTLRVGRSTARSNAPGAFLVSLQTNLYND